MLDLVIVPLSLGLELALEGIGGFLVIVRLWRMMRIMKKVTNAEQERMFRKEKLLETQLSRLQVNFLRLTDLLSTKHNEMLAQRAEIEELQQRHQYSQPTHSKMSPDAHYTKRKLEHANGSSNGNGNGVEGGVGTRDSWSEKWGQG